MTKTLLFTLCFGCLLVGGMWAQQKAQIRIKKNINGIESEETREVIIDENNSLEDVLRELNEQPQQQEGLMDQQIEISILSEGDFLNSKQGPRGFAFPGFGGSGPTQRKPALGVMLRETTRNNGNCKGAKAVSITEIIPNTPAHKAGLKQGDIILKLNKEEVNSTQQVIETVQRFSESGGVLHLLIEREGKRKKIKATLEPSPKFESAGIPFNLFIDPDSIFMFNPGIGDSLSIIQPFNLSNDGLLGGEAAFLGVTPSGKATTSGVSIRVEVNSPAEAMGLLDEDIILEFNGQAIGDFSALAAAVRKCKPEASIELLILRDGKEKRITGALGKRKTSTSEDFQIFHDFKGMDDEGNYFYDFEFNMDADDIQRQMQEFLRDFNGNSDFTPFEMPRANGLLRLEELDETEFKTLELQPNSLVFDQLSFIPNASSGEITIEFSLPSKESITVVLKDKIGHTLLYDEQPQNQGNYKRTVSLSAYPDGDYFIIIEQQGKSFAKQLVKYRP
jgi:membrane-associated protease RseP (regulator of RpoE activity)